MQGIWELPCSLSTSCPDKCTIAGILCFDDLPYMDSASNEDVAPAPSQSLGQGPCRPSGPPQCVLVHGNRQNDSAGLFDSICNIWSTRFGKFADFKEAAIYCKRYLA